MGGREGGGLGSRDGKAYDLLERVGSGYGAGEERGRDPGSGGEEEDVPEAVEGYPLGKATPEEVLFGTAPAIRRSTTATCPS